MCYIVFLHSLIFISILSFDIIRSWQVYLGCVSINHLYDSLVLRDTDYISHIMRPASIYLPRSVTPGSFTTAIGTYFPAEMTTTYHHPHAFPRRKPCRVFLCNASSQIIRAVYHQVLSFHTAGGLQMDFLFSLSMIINRAMSLTGLARWRSNFRAHSIVRTVNPWPSSHLNYRGEHGQ